MSFTAKYLESTPPQSTHINNPLSHNQLMVQEIEVLLSMIKRTTFLGEDIEPLYTLVLKLQKQHQEQTK